VTEIARALLFESPNEFARKTNSDLLLRHLWPFTAYQNNTSNTDKNGLARGSLVSRILIMSHLITKMIDRICRENEGPVLCVEGEFSEKGQKESKKQKRVLVSEGFEQLYLTSFIVSSFRKYGYVFNDSFLSLSFMRWMWMEN
jgi:hypothetical protein